MLSSLLSGTKKKGSWAGTDKSRCTLWVLCTSQSISVLWHGTLAVPGCLNSQGTAWDSLPKSGSLLPALPVAYGSSGIPLFSQVCKSFLLL